MALLRRGEQDQGEGSAPGASKIRDLYDEGSKAIRKEARDFWINKSFVAGEQWITWNTATRRIEAMPRDPDRVRFPVNRLRTNSRIIMAKLLRRALVFEVLPNEADDATIQGARLASSVLADTHREQNWEDVREEAAWALWLGGTGLLGLDWDPKAGKVIGDHPERPGEKVRGGDIRASALTICEVATEPGTRDIERAAWWIRAAALPASEVRAMYGLKDDPVADASAVMSPLQQKLMREDGTTDNVSLTLVLNYYERPNPKRPKGHVAVVVGDEVVSSGPWPFPFTDRLNVVRMRETVVNGRWTGDTILSDTIGPQTALNMSWSSQVEHGKLAGNARLMIPETSIDMADMLTDEPGEPIPYSATPGMPQPSYLAPPQMPQWWSMQPNELTAVIDDICGVHDVSRGDAPSGITSGVGLSLLAEQDDTPLGRMAKEMAEGFGRFASLVLETYAAKVTESRTAKSVAANARPETSSWNGAALCGQTSATVPLDSVQPRSRAAQFQMAVQLHGMFPTEMTLAQFATIADLPGASSIIEGADPNIARARSENHEMALGVPAIPYRFDHHATHIREHNRFRMSDRYEQLDREGRELVDLHIQAHEVLAAEEAGEQVNKAGVSPALANAAAANEPPPVGAPPSPIISGPQDQAVAVGGGSSPTPAPPAAI